MPARSSRAKITSLAPPVTESVNVQSVDLSGDNDYSQMTASALLHCIREKNTDPVIGRMLSLLSDKLQEEIHSAVEGEKRSRTVVISGVPEPPEGLSACERAADLKKKVDDIFNVLNVDCSVSELYRIGKVGVHPRLVKVVLPSKFYWRSVLASAHILRSSSPNIFIRRSMTEEERRMEYDLRQQAKERNRGKATREWVVYRGQLKRVAELPHRPSGNH